MSSEHMSNEQWGEKIIWRVNQQWGGGGGEKIIWRVNQQWGGGYF